MSRGADNDRWFFPDGSLAGDDLDLVIDDHSDGWQHTGQLNVTLAPGESITRDLGDWEAMILPLAGAATVAVEGQTYELAGRPDVFAGPADVLYAPRGSTVTVTGAALTGNDEAGNDGGLPSRIAICLAHDPESDGRAKPPVAHLPASEVPVELRGAGNATRQVRNFGVPGVLEANRMIAVEVITPAGNWSSWPPHKHDTTRPGVESELEEIYYYETQATDERGVDPIGYQRVYGTEDRPIDVLAEVRTGDVVLVPHGWHGPAIAAPNADLYYLNVMAGPGPERSWLICDDPAHGWVREAWPELPIDPRLADE